MADSDKSIVITPATGTTGKPKIEFTGHDNSTLTLYTLDDGSASFENASGQLLSVQNNTMGDLFSVSDNSGIPSIKVDEYGTVVMGSHGTKTLIGTDKDNDIDALQVQGSVSFSSEYGTVFHVQEDLEDPDIYSVTDRSGVPLIRVTDEGAINLGEYGGYVDSPKIRSPYMPSQIVKGTTNVRYAGNFSSGGLAYPITSVYVTPKFGNSMFKIEIVMPVNATDDWNEDAVSDGNKNGYFYGQVERSFDNGSTYSTATNLGQSQSGGNDAHIEMSPPRVGAGDSGYEGHRYRTYTKHSIIFDEPAYSLGQTIIYRFKLICLSSGNITIGEPRGFGGDDNYPAQPWGLVITEIPR